MDDLAVDVRQSKIAAAILVCQLRMVQAEQVQDRGVHVGVRKGVRNEWHCRLVSNDLRRFASISAMFMSLR